jgi:hypothetical protein
MQLEHLEPSCFSCLLLLLLLLQVSSIVLLLLVSSCELVWSYWFIHFKCRRRCRQDGRS